MSTFNFVLFHSYPLSVCVACSETQRQCRWDRHNQPHNTRDHLYPLPDADTTAAVDRNCATDLSRVVE
ncbi:hypothetical protein EXE50_06030 [Halorubrum sp. ARQ200]|nr:hypothetical protein EXE50_06030 [Halorubrum sp. ARQ200]